MVSACSRCRSSALRLLLLVVLCGSESLGTLVLQEPAPGQLSSGCSTVARLTSARRGSKRPTSGPSEPASHMYISTSLYQWRYRDIDIEIGVFHLCPGLVTCRRYRCGCLFTCAAKRSGDVCSPALHKLDGGTSGASQRKTHFEETSASGFSHRLLFLIQSRSVCLH